MPTYSYRTGTERGANLSETFLVDVFPTSANGSELTRGNLPAAPLEALICLSILFCVVGLVGIVGNFLVIYVILRDRKMRNSVTNLFIMNLAAADFLIMVFGVPEIAQFMANRGWVLGSLLCKLHRYVLVFSLYVSIMSLVSVCVERYVAIVHPIKAHILCSRRRIIAAICIIWPLSLALGLPTALFNQVRRPHPKFPVKLCMIHFPGDHVFYNTGYKFAECVLFFLGPVVIQIVMYSIICLRLFAGTEALHRRQTVRAENGGHRERDSDAIKARKGVVKMLIASVLVYFFSYAPAQVPLFYNAISRTPFSQNWSFLVLLMTLSYINSAANPVLYSIFSQNFRRKFTRALCRCLGKKDRQPNTARKSSMADSYAPTRATTRFTSMHMTTSMSDM